MLVDTFIVVDGDAAFVGSKFGDVGLGRDGRGEHIWCTVCQHAEIISIWDDVVDLSHIVIILFVGKRLDVGEELTTTPGKICACWVMYRLMVPV